jgi:hypothetical protein
MKQTLAEGQLVLAATAMFVGTTSYRRRNQHLISSVTINTTVSYKQSSHGDGRDTSTLDTFFVQTDLSSYFDELQNVLLFNTCQHITTENGLRDSQTQHDNIKPEMNL